MDALITVNLSGTTPEAAAHSGRPNVELSLAAAQLPKGSAVTARAFIEPPPNYAYSYDSVAAPGGGQILFRVGTRLLSSETNPDLSFLIRSMGVPEAPYTDKTPSQGVPRSSDTLIPVTYGEIPEAVVMSQLDTYRTANGGRLPAQPHFNPRIDSLDIVGKEAGDLQSCARPLQVAEIRFYPESATIGVILTESLPGSSAHGKVYALEFQYESQTDLSSALLATRHLFGRYINDAIEASGFRPSGTSGR